jgi:hypothetical protein
MTAGEGLLGRFTRSARWAFHTAASLSVFLPLLAVSRRGVTHGSGVLASGRFVAVDHPDFWPPEGTAGFSPGAAVIRHANSFLADDLGADVRGFAVAIQRPNGAPFWEFLTNTGERAEWANVPMWTERLWGMIRFRGHVYFRRHPEAIPNAMAGLRRAPTSYADVVYHSQIALRLAHPGRAPRLFRLRALREGLDTESGLIAEDAADFTQQGGLPRSLPDPLYGRAYRTRRAPGEQRPKDALRQEFTGRLGAAPVVYLIQAQLRADEADPRHVAFNPMVPWDPAQHPWETIGRVEVRAPLAPEAPPPGGFSLAVHPSFIAVPPASSVDDYTSIPNLRVTLYAVMQRARRLLRI